MRSVGLFDCTQLFMKNRLERLKSKGLLIDKRDEDLVVNGKKYWLGRFDTAESASIARNKKARQLRGEFYFQESSYIPPPASLKR